MADSSEAVLRYAFETTWGTTPSVAGQEIPITSFNPGYEKNVIEENRITGNPEVTGIARGTHGASPSMGFELSFTDLDEMLAAFLRHSTDGTWTADTPSVGTDRIENGSAKPSLSLEVEYQDISKFVAITGARPQQLQLSIALNQAITGSLQFSSKAPASGSATIFTGSPTAATLNPIFNTVDHITVLEEGGSAIAEVFGLDLTIDLSTRRKEVVGQADPFGIGMGKVRVTGSLSTHFEDVTELAKLYAHTASSIVFQLTDSAGNVYDFNLPALVYNDGNPDVTGPDQDVPLVLGFSAYKDASTGATIRIDRTPV